MRRMVGYATAEGRGGMAAVDRVKVRGEGTNGALWLHACEPSPPCRCFVEAFAIGNIRAAEAEAMARGVRKMCEERLGTKPVHASQVGWGWGWLRWGGREQLHVPLLGWFQPPLPSLG